MSSADGSFDPSNADHIEEIKVRNEIAQLDRDWLRRWEHKREYYTTRGFGRNGFWEGFIMGIGEAIVLASWLMKTDGVWIGVSIIVFGAILHIPAFIKTENFLKAESRYQNHRQELLDLLKNITKNSSEPI